MVGLDFETNGYSKFDTFKPIQIGLVYMQPGIRPVILAADYISGAKWISRPAYETHRIQLKDCKDKPGPEAYSEILKLASRQPVCVHAKGTERKILKEIYKLEDVTWIDTLTLSRKHLPNCPNHRLQTVVEYLGLMKELEESIPGESWHNALFDAAASVLIARKLLQENPTEKACQ